MPAPIIASTTRFVTLKSVGSDLLSVGHCDSLVKVQDIRYVAREGKRKGFAEDFVLDGESD